ncbi:MAG: hypothetical protein CSB46_00635, partial [Micrococcales bacterium]
PADEELPETESPAEELPDDARASAAERHNEDRGGRTGPGRVVPVVISQGSHGHPARPVQATEEVVDLRPIDPAGSAGAEQAADRGQATSADSGDEAGPAGRLRERPGMLTRLNNSLEHAAADTARARARHGR